MGDGSIIVNQTTKCSCGRIVKLTDLDVINTGVMFALNNVCKGCKEGARSSADKARLVCVKCKSVIGLLKPGKDKTGFEIKAGKCYHVAGCDQCCPGETSFPLVEKKIWNLKHNVKQ